MLYVKFRSCSHSSKTDREPSCFYITPFDAIFQLLFTSLSRRWASCCTFCCCVLQLLRPPVMVFVKRANVEISREVGEVHWKYYVGDRLIVNCVPAVYNNTAIALWILEPGAIFLKGSLREAIERITGCRCVAKGIDGYNTKIKLREAEFQVPRDTVVKDKNRDRVFASMRTERPFQKIFIQAQAK